MPSNIFRILQNSGKYGLFGKSSPNLGVILGELVEYIPGIPEVFRRIPLRNTFLVVWVTLSPNRSAVEKKSTPWRRTVVKSVPYLVFSPPCRRRCRLAKRQVVSALFP